MLHSDDSRESSGHHEELHADQNDHLEIGPVGSEVVRDVHGSYCVAGRGFGFGSGYSGYCSCAFGYGCYEIRDHG